MKHTLITISVVVVIWELLIKGGYIPGLWDIVTIFFITYGLVCGDLL